MNKTIANILFAIYIIVLIFEFLVLFKIIAFSEKILQYNWLAFLIISFGFIFTFNRLTIKILRKKSSEEVRIIYKEAEKEKTADDFKDKKDKDKAIGIANAVLDGLDQFTSDKIIFADKVLSRFSKFFYLVQGYFFIWDEEKQIYSTIATYAYYAEDVTKNYQLGEGIVGQVAKSKKLLVMDNVPKDYINVVSGLGDGTPNFLTFLPIIKDDKTIAIIEFATFKALPTPTDKIFDSLGRALAKYIEKFV